MNMPGGYEKDILMTLKAFSNKDAYDRKTPHKLQGRETWSLDVKARNDKYRMLYYVDDGICKIINLCTEETH
jgi:mRNA-degrading endonuclease RelE of RelBE toxin-antitoxin system